MPKRWTIAFDADDTLWHNERYFRLTQDVFADRLAPYAEAADLRACLLAAEQRNLGRYGFGIKGFVLSMIETAIEVTEARVPATVIAELIAAGQDMLAHPVDLLPGAAEVLEVLAPEADLLLITKGDLLDQERKIAESGLADAFDRIEIVSDKTVQTYAHIFARHDTPHQMMVGNSLRSDVIPALGAGLWGVHVPHELTWEYEAADPPQDHRHFRRIETLQDLPALVRSLS